MKVVISLFLLLLITPAFGQLTKEDMRAIIKEEVPPIVKAEIAASEKRLKEYIDLKIETVNARIDAVEKSLNARIETVNTRIDVLEKSIDGKFDVLDTRMDDVDSRFNRIWLAIIALITAAIALPQLIIIYAERKRGREIQMLLEQLREKTEGPETGANQ